MESRNLWAPWRIGYVQGLTEKKDCFICHNIKNPSEDAKNFVLWRTNNSIVILNHFPYNNGHLLIAPVRHIPDLDQASDNELLELIKLTRESQKVLSKAVKPHGFNIGINIGRYGGAGLPGHVHLHIVPRWDGDTNFMATCSDTKVISQSLAELFNLLIKTSQEYNLPGL